MDDLQHREVYQGHEIEVDVTRLRAHAFSWVYLIDGKVVGESVKLLPDAETALKFGIGAARARAESLG